MIRCFGLRCETPRRRSLPSMRAGKIDAPKAKEVVQELVDETGRLVGSSFHLLIKMSPQHCQIVR